MKLDLLVVKNMDTSVLLDLTRPCLFINSLLAEDILSIDNLEVITPCTSLSQLLSKVLLGAILLSINLDWVVLDCTVFTSLLLVTLYKYPDAFAWKVFITL